MDLNDLQTKTIRMYEDGESNRRLEMDVFNGRIYISVRNKENTTVFKRSFDDVVETLLFQNLKKILDAGSGNSLPMLVMQYDRDNRKWNQDYTLSVSKDDAGKCYIDIKTTDDKMRFSFGRVNNVMQGSEKMADVEQSLTRLRIMLSWMSNQAQLEKVLTSRKRPRNANGGGQQQQRSGGGGGNSGGDGGGGRADSFGDNF